MIRTFSCSLLVIILSACSTLAQMQIDFPKETIAPIDAPFKMASLTRPTFPDRVFSIREYGAVEGGVVKNTSAIRKAIEAAAASGGGHVLVPAGKWLTGPIHFENNIDLHLAEGAELLFSQEYADYLPVVFSRHEDTECYKHSAYLYANGKTNIAITGKGVLNGQGKPWWGFKQTHTNVEALLREMGEKDVPVTERIFDGTNDRILRPAFFQPMNCTNVLVEGVTFLYGGFWTITPTYCENVIVRRVRIETEGPYGHTPNGDGVDPSSCKNVLIEHCVFNTGDDCVAIKSGRDRDGRRVGKPTENVVVRHCAGYRGHGGIVIGSETSGDVRNVYGYDCSFNGTDRIVRVKTARGRGGVIENLWFKDLRADTIEMEAIHLNMLYTGKDLRLPAREVDQSTPRMRNIHIENLTCGYGKTYGLEVLGLPEMPVENVTFKNIRITSAKGINLQDASALELTNVEITPEKGPGVLLTDVQKVGIDGLKVPENVKPLLKLRGATTKEILLKNSGTSLGKEMISRGSEVPSDALRIEP